MTRTVIRMGIDDTDSEVGMCTTYLGYRIVSMLRKRGDQINGYPRLVRLNPNVPWRTRGNGAVGITFSTDDPQGAKSRIESMVRRSADVANGANPGLAFLESRKVPDSLEQFAREALWRVIPRASAQNLARDAKLECHTIGNGQGLVGALSAIGYAFGDHTMELLAYRRTAHIGKERRIDETSVRNMHERTFPATFNSYDTKSRRVLFAPHGPDPVLYGIRGEDAKTLVAANRTIRSETPQGYMIYVSNQGTGDHLHNTLDAAALRAHESGLIKGVLCAEPHIVSGGHVRLEVDSSGSVVDCYVYRATQMGALARSLVRGDVLRLGGGVRRAWRGTKKALNVETIDILELARIMRKANPMCHTCNKSMKSKGVGQDFECVRCGRKARSRVTLEMARNIRTGLYVAAPSAQRHLSRPAHRTARTRTVPPRLAAWMI